MDTCGKMLFAVLFATATVTEAMNYLALPRMGRSQNYVTYPTMGRRNYLAFPRMGRGQAGGGAPQQPDGGADCCLTGLKTEWVPQEEGGSTRTLVVCKAPSCCPGLGEVLAQKPDGSFYSMCIPPPSPQHTQRVEDTSRRVLQKLNELLRN